MKTITLVFVFLIMGSISYSNEWEMTHYMYGDLPFGIECQDNKNCFIASNGDPIRIYKSIDSGKTWDLIYAEFKLGFKLWNISAPDTNNIFLDLDKGNLYHSSNGGYSFNKIDLGEITWSGASYNTDMAMYNKNIGVFTNANHKSDYFDLILITKNGWKSFDEFSIIESDMETKFYYPRFINDSLIYLIGSLSFKNYQKVFIKLNINSFQFDTSFIASRTLGIRDLYVIDDTLLFICGNSNTLQGGSGHDAIYKSTDGGETWRRVLDLYTADSKLTGLVPFGLQSIAFKDETSGIAVGQFGKIVYTYDGGESWIYEHNLHDTIAKKEPPTMIVRYAGDTPILATFTGHFFRMTEDTYAPGPDDTLSISGRVWEGDKGQAGIPIAIGYRVTMTDENGYYKFTQLPKGNYKVRALNKYYDDVAHPAYYYKPYAYHPEQHEFELTGDTTGIDFNAEDIREYYDLFGSVVDKDGKGIEGIELQMGDSLSKTDIDGQFEFIRLEKKQYNVTPLNEGYTYIPETYVIGLISDTTDIVFQAIPDTTNYIETIEPDPYGLQIEKRHIAFFKDA
jgi:hypothetical protein